MQEFTENKQKYKLGESTYGYDGNYFDARDDETKYQNGQLYQKMASPY